MRKMLVSIAGLALAALAAPAHAQFQVRTVDGGDPEINDINEGEAALAGNPTVGTASSAVLNFGNGGDFNNDTPFPGNLNGTNDFALEALGRLTFNAAGTYTFIVNSDDGFRVRTGVASNGSGGTTLFESTGPKGASDVLSTPFTVAAGDTRDVRLTFFEQGGDEVLEFSFTRNGGAEALIGSNGDITVSAIPEPASLGLLGLGGVGLLARRRRQA